MNGNGAGTDVAKPPLHQKDGDGAAGGIAARHRPAPRALTSALVARVAREYLRPYAAHVVLMAVCSAVSAYSGSQLPLLYRAMVEALPRAAAEPEKLYQLVAKMIGAVLGISVLEVVGKWVRSHVGESVGKNLRRDLFGRLQGMPYWFFGHGHTGNVSTLVATELTGAKSALGRSLPMIIDDVFNVVFTFMMLAQQLTPTLALTACVVMSAVVYPLWVGEKRLVQYKHDSLAANAELHDTMQESLSRDGWLLFRSFRAHHQAEEKFLRASGTAARVSVRTTVATSALEQGFLLSTALVSGVAFYLGGTLFLDAAMITSGSIVQFTASLGRLFGPVSELLDIRMKLTTAAIPFSRIFTYLDLLLPGPGLPSPVPPPHEGSVNDDMSVRAGCGTIPVLCCNSIAFQYPPAIQEAMNGPTTLESSAAVGPEQCSPPHQKPNRTAGSDADDDGHLMVLRGISCEFLAGHTYSLVGANGAGKTTLAQLLARLYLPTTGRVLLDNVDTQCMSEDALCKRVLYVPSTGAVLHDTIRANLELARPLATRAELECVCSAVGIASLIAAMPLGYATTVGERGIRLSGGEAQRLALARALLADPQVIILDEALSQVDGAAETGIVQRLRGWRGLSEETERLNLSSSGGGGPVDEGDADSGHRRVLILISHRFSTVAMADTVMVLRGGVLCETGAPGRLAKAATSRFRELFPAAAAFPESCTD